MRYLGEKALPILKKNGAQVDPETKIARMPGELVEHALSTAPKSFVLGARNPIYDISLPSPVSRVLHRRDRGLCLDFDTGERRYGTQKTSRMLCASSSRWTWG